MHIENIINGLLTDREFSKKISAYLEEEYFTTDTEKIIVRKITDFQEKYKKIPSPADVKLLVENDMNLTEGETQDALNYIKTAVALERPNSDMLFAETEKWAQQRAIENGVLQCIDIMKEHPEKAGLMPDIMKKALSVSFTTSLGHDFFRDAPKRYEFYTAEDEIIKTDVELLNQALGGGFRRKAIYVFMGRTNIGKTLWLCHIATALMKLGYNVLYVSCEMSEEMIGQRLDANLLNYIMEELGQQLPKKEYLSRVRSLYEKTEGKLKIKGYPTGTANANHLRAFLNECKLKDDFQPDVIIGDYLNIFASSRLPASAMQNPYLYVKAITEEMRGIADEFNVPFVTATQTNRGGSGKGKDTDMDDISDSFGLPMTADWMGAIIQNEELFAMQKYLLKTIKSRFADNIHKIYTMGVDRSHMKLMDLPDHEQELPVHIKDQLKLAAAKSKSEDDVEAVEQLLENFDFSEE